MYGRLGYYHFMAFTQIHPAREAEAHAEAEAKTAIEGATEVAVKSDGQTLYICCVCVAAIVGAFGLATAYALMVGA